MSDRRRIPQPPASAERARELIAAAIKALARQAARAEDARENEAKSRDIRPL